MVYLAGFIFSYLATGYVFLKILDNLYERKYTEKKWIYYFALLLHTLLNALENQLGLPMFNILYSLAILCMGSTLLYHTAARDVIINSAAIVIYGAIVDVLVTTIFSVFMQNNVNITLHDSQLFFVSGIANGLALLCTCHFFSKVLKGCNINKTSMILHTYMVFLLIFEFYLILYLLQLNIDVNNNGLLLIFCIGFSMVDAGVLYLFDKISVKYELEKKAELLEQQRELLMKYYEGLQERFHESQKLLHDMKKHLQVISSLDGKENDIQKEYVNELLEEIKDIQKQFQCSDKIVGAILWDKIQVCNHDHINLDIHMQDILFDFMEKTDVTVLFSNLLDNAIEACKECPKQTRKIFLRIHSFKDYIVIKMVNTMNREPQKKDHKLVSSKEKHQGLGMTILFDLADKYCGNMNYSYTDMEFETNIILSVNSKM